MPYYRRKKPMRKRTYRRRQPKRYQPKNLDRRIKKLEHTQELKYVDYVDTTAITTTGVVIPLSILAQGDDADDRIGEQVTAKYMNMKFRLTKSVASANVNIVRVLVFWDLQTNGVGPIQFTSTSPNTGLLDNLTITDRLLSPPNYRAKERYKILYDKVFIDNAQSSAMTEAKFIRRNFKLGGAKIKYSDSNGNTASLVSRSLWFMILGNTASTTETAPGNSFRFYFTDA